MDKSGEATGEQFMVFWFLFLLVMIGGGIALGVSIFFGAGYDFRETESGILSHKIQLCLIENAIDFENVDGFYLTCGLSKEILYDKMNDTKISFEICKGKCAEGERVLQVGSDFESCDFIGKNEKYMKCAKSTVENNGATFEIIVGSNHNSRRTNG